MATKSLQWRRNEIISGASHMPLSHTSNAVRPTKYRTAYIQVDTATHFNIH